MGVSAAAAERFAEGILTSPVVLRSVNVPANGFDVPMITLLIWLPPPETVPLIVKAPRVLLVSVSVVARPTKVSVLVGRVKVPVLTMVPMTGDVNVLLVIVSVVARPTKVSVLVGSVNVPVLTIVPMTGLVKVLFVNVSVVARPTRVSVLVGRDRDPVFTMDEITGAVRVLLVRVCVVSVPTKVVLASGTE